MATSPQSMPPGAGPGSAPSAAGPSTGAGAASEGQPNPQLKNALGQLTAFAQAAQQYAKAYPQCAPEMRIIGEQLQKCLMKTTQAQQPAEPATPPV